MASVRLRRGSEVAPIEADAGGSRVAPHPGAHLRRVVVVNKYPPAEVARPVLVLLSVAVGAYLLWRSRGLPILLHPSPPRRRTSPQW